MKSKRVVLHDYIRQSDVEQMAFEARIRTEHPTWVGVRRCRLKTTGEVHACTWALCHVRQNDYGNEVLGAFKPILECRHGFDVRVPYRIAQALYERSQKEDR